MTRPVAEPCGCRSNEREWLTLCPTHNTEFQERHARAQAEHEALQIERDLLSSRPPTNPGSY